MDLAACVQVAAEQVALRLTRSVAREGGMKNLCLAGDLALNCVARCAVES
jgi:carbamoyltransferase